MRGKRKATAFYQNRPALELQVTAPVASTNKLSSLLGRLAIVLCLAATAVWLFFFRLGAMSFIDPDEGRYALAAREMWEHGNWFTATLNLAPYPDKPAPFFWLLGALIHGSAPVEWAARLCSALPALGTLGLVFCWSYYRLGLATAIFSSAVLMTAGEFFALGRIVRMDTLLTFMVSLSLFAGFELLNGTMKRGWWLVYLSAALGLLVKGPVAIALVGLIIFGYALLSGEGRNFGRLRVARGSLLMITIAACWYVPATFSNPTQMAAFIMDHNVARFLTGKVGHPQPWYFFFWVLPACFMPWSIFLPATLRRVAGLRAQRSHPHLFLITWCAVTFCLFSFSQAKLAPYILPLFPPLAILTGETIAWFWAHASESGTSRSWRTWAGIWLGICAVTTLAALIAAPLGPGIALHSLLLLSLICAISGGVVFATITFRREFLLPAVMFSTSVLVCTLWSLNGATIMSRLASLRQAAPLAAALPPDTRLYAYKTHGYSLSFYSGKRVSQLNTAAKAAALLAQSEPRAILIRRKHLIRLQKYLQSPAAVWWQGLSPKVLLANRPPPLSGSEGYGLLLPAPSAAKVAVRQGHAQRPHRAAAHTSRVTVEAPASPPVADHLVEWLAQVGRRIAGLSAALW